MEVVAGSCPPPSGHGSFFWGSSPGSEKASNTDTGQGFASLSPSVLLRKQGQGCLPPEGREGRGKTA